MATPTNNFQVHGRIELIKDLVLEGTSSGIFIFFHPKPQDPNPGDLQSRFLPGEDIARLRHFLAILEP